MALGDARVKILAGAAETGGAVALLDYQAPGLGHRIGFTMSHDKIR